MAKYNGAASKPKILKAWTDAMGSPTTQQNYKDGVNAVTVSPMQLAAAQADKAVTNYTSVITGGAWAAALNAVPISTYKTNAVAMAGRLGTGAQKAAPKYSRFLDKFAPVWDEMKAASKAIPGSGIAAAQQRANAALQILMQNGRKNAS